MVDGDTGGSGFFQGGRRLVKKYSFDEDDILTYPHPQRLIPKTFPKGGGMHRFVTADDLSFRAGFTELSKGESVSSYFWYDELWLIMRGRGVVKNHPEALDRRGNQRPQAGGRLLHSQGHARPRGMRF